MSSLSVLMVTPYYEPVIGGISSFVRGLSQALRIKGVRVEIVTCEGMLTDQVHPVGANRWRFAARAARIIRRLNPDVIHAHAHWYTLRAALLSQHARQPPVVFSVHTAWPLLGPFRRLALRRMLLRCKAITFPSNHSLTNHRIPLPDSMKHVIPPGTSKPSLDGADAERIRRLVAEHKWTRVVGYVGNFSWPQKVAGFRLLLEAIADKRLRETGLVVAGSGPYLRNVMDEAASYDLADRIVFLGPIRNPHALYAVCDIYCHPSLQEGMSLSVLEAMRHGLPVVAFREPFMQEIIDDNVTGMLVEPSAQALSNAIDELLSNRKFAQAIGAGARDRVAVQYDWSHVAQTFLGVYGASG